MRHPLLYSLTYVFTSFKSAQNCAALSEDQTMFILVKAARGVPVEVLRDRLAARLHDVEKQRS